MLCSAKINTKIQNFDFDFELIIVFFKKCQKYLNFSKLNILDIKCGTLIIKWNGEGIQFVPLKKKNESRVKPRLNQTSCKIENKLERRGNTIDIKFVGNTFSKIKTRRDRDGWNHRWNTLYSSRLCLRRINYYQSWPTQR